MVLSELRGMQCPHNWVSVCTAAPNYSQLTTGYYSLVVTLTPSLHAHSHTAHNHTGYSKSLPQTPPKREGLVTCSWFLRLVTYFTVVQGRSHQVQSGQVSSVFVSTQQLGGSGGMPPPRGIFLNLGHEVASETIFGPK